MVKAGDVILRLSNPVTKYWYYAERSGSGLSGE